MIITNGSDPILSAGTNVSFCYKNMEWTTGDASGGVNGYGGSPASVGINKGDGIAYIQYGRFDTAGTVFNPPPDTSGIRVTRKPVICFGWL
ncbi:MAG: hypothetical protein IPJ66_10285 [Bacteroidetes bacterium]|nr:hypothetical protein [Bacteroidota bacterium]